MCVCLHCIYFLNVLFFTSICSNILSVIQGLNLLLYSFCVNFLRSIYLSSNLLISFKNISREVSTLFLLNSRILSESYLKIVKYEIYSVKVFRFSRI